MKYIRLLKKKKYPIFDANIREYLGATGTINKKIMETLKNPDERVNFSIIITELQLLQKISLMRTQVVVLRN